MKLASYCYHGISGYGLVEDDGIFDLTSRLGADYPDLKSVLTAGEAILGTLREMAERGGPRLAKESVTFLPVIENPGKIVCVGLNYEAHRLETRHDKTQYPTLFLRTATSQTGHDTAIIRPYGSEQLDFEGEIALVIGRGGRRISPENALEHVAGYACYNDASVRDWQFHTQQWTPGKNFDATGSFGPWLVTRGEIADDAVMTLVTRLNGQEVQRTTTEYLIRGFADLIAYISAFTTLEPGDVIVTGTPGGIGSRRTPPLFMQPGDVVEVEVDRIGVLRNIIQAEETQ